MEAKGTESNLSGFNWRKLGVNVLLVVLGSVATILIQQLFLPRTVDIRSEAELRNEIISEQYPSLLKVKRFAALGSDAASVVFIRRYVGPDSSILGTAEKGPSYFLPRVVHEREARKDWERLVSEIRRMNDQIEPKVYKIYKRIYQYTRKYPLPDTGSLKAIRNSAYSDSNTTATFISLHEDLRARINTVVGFQD